MDPTSCPTPSARTLHCALELSKNSWLLAIQFPDRPQPSVYAIEGGNTEKLMAKLTAAQDCWAKVSGAVPAITVCYDMTGADSDEVAQAFRNDVARRYEMMPPGVPT